MNPYPKWWILSLNDPWLPWIKDDKEKTLKDAIQLAENKAEIEKYEEYKAAKDAGEQPELEEGEEAPTKPHFDEKYFLFHWDEEHPDVMIPDEVGDDVDNDWIIDKD